MLKVLRGRSAVPGRALSTSSRAMKVRVPDPTETESLEKS